MRCVEFETRLNELLDGRVSPAVDAALAAHARRCTACAEMLVAHEALLEGVASLPAVAMTAATRSALAPRVVAAVKSESRESRSFEPTAEGGSFNGVPLAALTSAALTSEAASCEPFRAERALDVATRQPAMVAKNRAAALGIAGMILAAAAAILIVVLPWFQGDATPEAPDASAPLLVETNAQPSTETSPTSIARAEDERIASFEEEPIAWVGYQVADGLKPVTSSMVSYLRELRKRPLFRSDDASGRSSFFTPRDDHDLAA